MPTGYRIAIVKTNSLLSKERIQDQLISYLLAAQNETFAGLLQGNSGTLDSDVIGLAGDGTDRFRLDMSNADKVVVGSGQVLTLVSSSAGVTSQIYFENTSAKVYHIGLSYAQVEATVGLNRKQVPEYQSYEDQIGRVGNPDTSPAPADTAGVKLRLYIDDLTRSGETYAGRKARVWLTVPLSADANTAFYEATVGFDGTNNYIDIPYSGSNGPLGQDTSVNPPSTTPSDYKVWVKGPRVDSTNFSSDTAYAYLGTVTGAGAGVAPTVFSTTNQLPIFLFSLDRAYDGAGSGSGRVMHIDSGAMELRQYTGDAFDPNLYGMSFKDPDGNEVWNMSTWGRVADSHRFKDDFIYHQGYWSHDGSTGSMPTWLYEIVAAVGATTNTLMKPWETSPDLGNVSGVLEILVDGATSSVLAMTGPTIGVKDMLPAFCCRFALSRVGDQNIYLSFARPTGVANGPGFGIEINDANIRGRQWDATPTTTYTTSLGTLSADTMYWIFAYTYYDASAPNNYKYAFWLSGMSSVITLDSSLDWSTNNYESWVPRVQIGTDSGGVYANLRMWIDYWEFWTRGAILGL